MTSEFIPKKQRALVFQGGGSLGAYEAGVFQAVYEKLTEKDKPLFDIVAGTSIGAINAAILVSYVVENKTWKGSAERLNEFWDYVCAESYADATPGFSSWWDYWSKIDDTLASGEAARRYYSSKEFELYGVSKVFSPLPPLMDSKFLDPQNTWFRYDSKPLKRSLEKFARFPIATSFDANQRQPRLLLVSVDVQEGMTVVFDSYVKDDGQRKSEYGEYGSESGMMTNGKKNQYEHVIRYNEGITSDHVIASASVPINFNYTTILAENNQRKNSHRSKISIQQNNSNNNSNNSNETRYFWDGGLLSNTPLREVLEEHRNYWFKVKKYGTVGSMNQVPDLEVYVVDIHPTKQTNVPWDHDGVLNRNNDITFHDRTVYDKKVAVLVGDYISLTNELIKAAKDNGIPNNIIDELLKRGAKSKHRTGKNRAYHDLLEGRFNIDKIVRLERTNDYNTISNKTFDFSVGTVNHLREQGYTETINDQNLQRD